MTAPAFQPPISNHAKVVLGVEGMVSPRSEQMIEAALSRLPGVNASASFASRSLRIEFDRNRCALPEIVRRLDELGLRLRPGGPIAPPKPTPIRDWLRVATEYHKLMLAIVGGLLLLAATITRFTEGPAPLRYVLVAASGIVAGWYTARDTFQVLRHFHFDIDVLMFAAAIGAALLGHFEEGAFLLVLFAFGGAGEEIAMDRARRAIEALAKLAPDTATLRAADGSERLVNVSELKLGDEILIRPFDRVPADGVVRSGASSIDQSPITGESVPVEKTAGSPVFAGTINGEGLLTATVSKLASESTLAKIVRMVQEAQTTKSPTELFTDQVERWYVPFVLISTATLIVAGPLAIGGLWSNWFYRAMAFLTAASPCALAIGTPAAVLSGIARAARIGVLVKGGVHLENLGRVNAIAFDKTGTLTAGRPQVTRIVPLDSVDEQQILALAASVDVHSAHPAASAIVGEASARGTKLISVNDAREIPGRGAAARIDGSDIYVGKLMREVADDPRIAPLAADGSMLAQVSRDNRAIGVIVLKDLPRPGAANVVSSLKQLGIRRCIMLTGDRDAVAQPVARELGIDETHAGLMPDEKVRLIRDLQRTHGPIAMIGDGVNDAPALASATVGIAMGGAGTDVAIETADVALIADDLGKLPDAIGLSRFSRNIIKQNLAIALGVISVLAPLAALGFTDLWIAVLFHEGSTVVVVLNALRLLVYKPRQKQISTTNGHE